MDNLHSNHSHSIDYRRDKVRTTDPPTHKINSRSIKAFVKEGCRERKVEDGGVECEVYGSLTAEKR